MTFVSVFYLFFLAAAASVFYLLPARFRTIWLLFVSYAFYLTWQPAFLVVLVAVTIAAYLFGARIAASGNAETRKKWLAAVIAVLLTPLIFFKYFNFLNDNLTAVIFGGFSSPNPIPPQPYLIPLGISFFTFQAISYIADVYRGYLKPETRITKVAVYLAFFPTILAGPIERARSILGQLDTHRTFDYANIRSGLQLILWGVFKKVVLADRMADFMAKMYAEPQNYAGVLIYFALLMSVFQLFCDFSAYSDIAVGTARIFGIRLSKNFDDRVYAAPSREIFWQGWHRSLTSWMRDYVFFPLSGGIRTRARLYVNLVVVYVLVGIWHSAAWGFVIWGFLNGVWLVLESITKAWRHRIFTGVGINTEGRSFYFFSWLFILHVGSIFGVFFRTESPRQALEFISNVANSNAGLFAGGEANRLLVTIVFVLFMDLINRRIPKNENFDAFIGPQKTWVRWALYVVLAELIIRYGHVFGEMQFRYFSY